jgi:hypothetical protein
MRIFLSSTHIVVFVKVDWEFLHGADAQSPCEKYYGKNSKDAKRKLVIFHDDLLYAFGWNWGINKKQAGVLQPVFL